MTEKEIEYIVMSRLPDRVVIHDQGTAVSYKHAVEVTGNKFPCDVIFVRDDGWTLGAPTIFEDTAYRMWADKWVGEARCHEVDGETRWTIKVYCNSAETS